MNKFISLLLCLILSLGMTVISVNATDSISVSIDNPIDGSIISNTSFNVEISASGSVMDTVLEFNGERMDDYILTESMLTIGEHTLTAFVIGNDGSVKSATSTFTVIKEIYNEELYNDLSTVDSSATNFSKSTVDLGYGVTVIPQVSKNWKGIVSVDEGPSANGDTAINITSEKSFSSSRPFYRFLPANSISSTLVFDIDMKINSGTNVLLSFEGSKGVTSYLATNTGYLFGKSGTILGTSETYTSGKWYNVKLIIDVVNDVADLYISHYDDKLSQTVTRQILNKSSVPDTGDIDDIRINYHGNASCGFSIDNVKITEEASFSGIKNLLYVYDAEESSDAYPDGERLTAVKVFMNEKIVVDDLSGMIEIINKNGEALDISSLNVSSDGSCVTIAPSTGLSPNEKYKINVNISANYSGALYSTDIASVEFKTAADSYSVTNVEFEVDSTRLITASQLKGKKLSSKIFISNNEGNSQNLSCVLAIRSGNMLVGLEIASITIPVSADEHMIVLYTPVIPNDITDATIQLMFLSGMTERKPVFSTYEVNY